MLADVFENFRNMCIKVYEIDPAHFLSAPGLAWQTCLKETEVELELITDVDMLLMIEEKQELEDDYFMQYSGIQKEKVSI